VTVFRARPSQRIEDHLQNVADMAGGALRDWPDMGRLAYAAGLLHDLGKCSCAWQQYLTETEASDAAGQPRSRRLEHVWSSADAADHLLKDLHRVSRRTITTAIVGHHGSMGRERGAGSAARVREALDWFEEAPDLLSTLNQRMLADGWGETVDPSPPTKHYKFGVDQEQAHACLSAWVEQEVVQRIIQSALVDADWTDAHAATQSREPQLTTAPSFHLFGDDFNLNNATGLKPSLSNRFEQLRTAVFDETVQAGHRSKGAPGFYLLDAPTGIGKTRSSLGFAFAHASHSKARRLIFAAPFISVTSQNVAATKRLVFGKGSGSEHVLEHHSMAEGQTWKARAATQNWDSPIIVTTSIQLLKSLHSCRLASIRKLHRLAGSIIVLDEWQTIPIDLLVASMQTLSILVRNFGVTVLLTSATPRHLEIRETLVPHVTRVVADVTSFEASDVARQRVQWNFAPAYPSWVDFAKSLQREPTASKLVIVNTRAAASEVTARVAQNDNSVLHLSTSMTPAHRDEVLGQVRHALKNSKPVTLIATQVIEAGVDVSFQLLWREAAPLESLVQAAGRCNRSSEYSDGGVVTVFEVGESVAPTAGYRKLAMEALRLCRQHISTPSDPLVMAEYEFSRAEEALVRYKESFQSLRDAKWVERSDSRFIEIERRYQLIDDLGVPVICYQSTPELIGRLIKEHDAAGASGDEKVTRRIRRELAKHSVSLPEWLAKDMPPEEGTSGLTVWHGPYYSLIGVETRRN
jgi:CRISPR-associated endonuclease/helicase Cas3